MFSVCLNVCWYFHKHTVVGKHFQTHLKILTTTCHEIFARGEKKCKHIFKPQRTKMQFPRLSIKLPFTKPTLTCEFCLGILKKRQVKELPITLTRIGIIVHLLSSCIAMLIFSGSPELSVAVATFLDDSHRPLCSCDNGLYRRLLFGHCLTVRRGTWLVIEWQFIHSPSKFFLCFRLFIP